MKNYILCVVFLLILSGCKTIQINSGSAKVEIENFQTLFKQGDFGYACFRIPAVIVTKNGTILAFAEARKKGCSDTGDIDLVMRSSPDNGKTWSDLKIVFDDGKNVCGNPAPVVDTKTGNIHLLTTWNNGDDHESEIIAGTSENSREIFHQVSKDNGTTWSKPKNITKSVKLSNWTWYATGPVHGIQIKNGTYKGRLVIPCDHITKNLKKKYAHSIYSDDNGQSWNLGGITPKDKVNECTVVELSNGNLMLNMRNYERDAIKGRQVAFSNDGGLTWENQYVEKKLPEPICQGSLLSIKRKGKYIQIFSNPSNSISRKNMSLTISRDNGGNWNEKISIFDGHAAYSDLAEMKNGKIIVLFEAGINNAYEGIHYKIVSIKE